MSQSQKAKDFVRARLIAENELPQVPDGWGVERLRFLLTESKERNGAEPVGQMLSVSEYRGVVPKDYEYDEHRRTDAELENYRVVRPGQLAVNSMWLNHLGLGVSEHLGHVSPAYGVYDVSPRLDTRFLHHLVRSNFYLKIYLRHLYGIRPNSFQIKSYDWASIPIIVPDLPTQKRIAAFLDRETARIDELIAKKERLFQLLTEHLRAAFDGLFLEGIATHAAFTSLPFQWMPRLPASWTLTKLKYLGEKGQKTTQMGPFGGMLTQLLQTDTGFKLYGQENTISRDFSKGSRWVSEATFRELSRYELKPGDIMLTRKGTLGKCASFPSGAVRGIADSDTIRIRLNHSLFSHWMLENTLQYASYVSEQIALEKRGAILAGLNTSIIEALLHKALGGFTS